MSMLLVTILTLSSCSLSDVFKEEPLSSTPSPASSENEFAVDSYNDNAASNLAVEEQKIVPETSPDEFISEDKKEVPPAITDSMAEVKPEEPKLEDFQKDPAVPEITYAPAAEAQDLSLGAEEKYHVQKGDTLMMVAFKIYGDYRKWKELKEWNKEKLTMKMGAGDVLRYYAPKQSFGWQPNGLPHMVKTGDSLGSISMEKYGTSRKWKNIYENNRPLIRDPNLIFAGFTIYYVPVRDIASENR